MEIKDQNWWLGKHTTMINPWDFCASTIIINDWCDEVIGKAGEQWAWGWVGDQIRFHFKTDAQKTMFLLRFCSNAVER